MAGNSKPSWGKHTNRDHAGLLNPSRDPHAITDKHSTASAPKTGGKSGAGITESGGTHSQGKL